MKAGRSIRRGLALLLSVMWLSSCAFDRIGAQQETATGLWSELISGRAYGQTFVCRDNNLYRIDLGTATYGRVNTNPVVFHLRSSPQALTDILSVTLSGPDVQNERPTSILFAPLPDSRGETFYFYIESPGATPGNAVTVYASEHDRYPEGTAYRDGEPETGDLAFTAYARSIFTLSGVLDGFLSRVAQDLSFFIPYGILILTLCACLLATVRHQASGGW